VTAQGLVIRPNVDGVIARTVATGVEVTGPEGWCSPATRTAGWRDGAAPRLFDLRAGKDRRGRPPRPPQASWSG